MMKVVEIDLFKKKDLNVFVQIPWLIYPQSDNPIVKKNWVPPFKMAVKDLLNLAKHPFYETSKVKAFIAYQNDRPIGRIMAIINQAYNKFHKSDLGFFGFFECIDNQDAASMLLDSASKYLRENGINKMQGPMNPGTNYECGMLIDNFSDPAQIMMTYNPPYYNDFFAEKFGYTTAMDLLAYKLAVPAKIPDFLFNIANRLKKKENIKIRNINLKNWDQELELMFDIYNNAWEDNWGFVPMTKAEFVHTAKDLKSILDPTLAQVVEINGHAAGFILALPDLNQVFHTIKSGNLSPMALLKILTYKRRVTRVRIITMGIKKEFRKMGLETLLYTENYYAIAANPKYTEIEMSWILKHNLEMNKPLLRFGAEVYKTYRLYEKNISNRG